MTNKVNVTKGAMVLEQVSGAHVAFIDALSKNGIGRVLANPRVATLDGREASLSVGSQVERGEGDSRHYVQLGTKLHIRPKQIPSQKIQLDLAMEWSGHVSQADQEANDKQLNYEVRTSLVTTLGESTLLARLLEVESQQPDAEEVIMLLVVTPEIVEATAQAEQRNVK